MVVRHQKIHDSDPNAKVLLMTGMDEAKCVHGKEVPNIGFLKKNLLQ